MLSAAAALMIWMSRFWARIDITEGCLQVGEHNVPLAEPVRVRLSAWLDHRTTTWPNTINPSCPSPAPHPRPGRPGTQFRWKKTDLRPQALREDRILADARALVLIRWGV